MRSIRAIREGWSQWRELEHREEDERDHLNRLFAYRDAFFAAIAMLAGLLILQPFLIYRLEEPFGIAALSLFPLGAITALALVFVFSWRFRSGGTEGKVAVLKTVRMVAGFIVGYGLLVALSFVGIIPLTIHPSFLVGSAVGVALAAVLMAAMLTRR